MDTNDKNSNSNETTEDKSINAPESNNIDTTSSVTNSLIKQDTILSTGTLLGIFGTLLVTILAIVQYFSFDQIVFATKGLEQRARKEVYPKTTFVKYPTYILKQDDLTYKIFNEVIKPPHFDTLAKAPYIEYQIQSPDNDKKVIDRLGLKSSPVLISTDQAEELRRQLNEHRIKPTEFYEAYQEESKGALLNGWVINYKAPGGYAGDIGMLIGFNRNKKITGYRMVNHNETPGLGVKANYPEFINPFIGKEAKDLPSTKQNFKPKLGIDTISGATITSIAISKGIISAYKMLNISNVSNPKSTISTTPKDSVPKNTTKPKVTKQPKKAISKEKENVLPQSIKKNVKLSESKVIKKQKKQFIKQQAKKKAKKKSKDKTKDSKNKKKNNFLEKLDKTEAEALDRIESLRKDRKTLQSLFNVED